MKTHWIFIFVLLFGFGCQEETTEIIPKPIDTETNPPGDNDDGGNDDDDDDDGGDDDDDEPGDPGDPVGADNSNLLFGNPSDATPSASDENNYLMDKNYYVMSYNRSRGIPNWVSWYLGPTSLGSTSRTDAYAEDTALPAGWFRATNSSYSNSGFTRGHNCPSGDRTASVSANEATFLMTNMIPQSANNNNGLWNNLEVYARNQVTAGNEVYVIMGNSGTGGTGTSGYAETIANGNITVPEFIWKVLVIIPNGDNDLSRVTANTRVIAVITPNVQSGLGSWQSYRVSVDAIETLSGYDLLSALPDDMETTLEQKVDTGS
ncbi:MAG TPA: DNA/RNA non-specific endonuclease [Cyclobacteriaceae bacterium]|nr:DNA/RNA non-specific endonuclease [Cyclobacteriaceae bacterium]